MLLFSDMLHILVRHASPSGPMCLRCLMLTLSGPVELLFLLCFMATWTSVVVSIMLVVWFEYFPINASVCVCVLCLTVLVDCLLNVFACCVGEVNVQCLVQVMVFFFGCVGFCWLIRVLSSKEYVCCVCLGVPYVRFLCLYEGCDF